jgi:peptidylamidoglycolate lyase
MGRDIATRGLYLPGKRDHNMRQQYSGVLKLALCLLLGAPASFSADNYQVAHGWPIVPDQFAFGEVSGVGVDSQNRVWIFHRGQTPIMVFDGASGKLLMAFGEQLIKKSEGLAVDAQDNIWLTDITRHLVYKFAKDGNLLMTLGVPDKAGLDTTHFDGPTDVAVASTGEFFVADGYGNSRIVKFDKNGKFMLEWGKKGNGPGEFDTPHGITVDNENRVYVADRGNARIQVFDTDGKFLREFKGDEIGRPWAVRFAKDGFLYVVDGGDMKHNPPDRARVLKMSLDGHVVDHLGTYGKSDGQLYWPHDLAVASNGDVYVGDIDVGMRVQKFVKK